MAKAKGQFYIIAAVFILISLTMLFGFTLFVEVGSLTLPTYNIEFDNLQNTIGQQNNWLQHNWWNLNWKTKTIVTIGGGYTDPVEVDAGITAVCDSIRVFQKTGSGFTEIASDKSGCNATFNANGGGTFEIYWNGTNMGKTTTDGTEVAPDSKTIVQLPQDACAHLGTIFSKKNIAFTCSATPLSNAYNYSVGFTATDFTYNGSVA